MSCDISVVIATHNRRRLLDRCLRTLAEQTQNPHSFEVIVADDGSDDGSADMAEILDTPLNLRVLRLPKRGKSATSNAAIEAAEGTTCLFLDDDVIPAPELIAEHLGAHRENPQTLGIGKLIQEPPQARDWYAHAYAEAWNQRYTELESRTPRWTDCYGANFSAPRATLLEVGGFCTELPATVDIELGFRLCRAGCKPIYLPRAEAIHDDQKPRKRIIEHTKRHGRLTAQFIERHPETQEELLGWFLETTPREVTLRRLCLALRLSPHALAVTIGLVPSKAWRRLWFGFLARYGIWLGVREQVTRRRWLELTRGVPVLMYHAFTDSGEKDRYVMPRASFALQMRVLRLLRYRVITLDRLADALRGSERPPSRAVVITIDDGYRDNMEIAEPILRRHRYPATIFLVSGRFGAENDWSDNGDTVGRALLTRDEAIAMRVGSNIRFGAHTCTHPSLDSQPDKTVVKEVAQSREELEVALGEPVETFAYPYGRYDERAVQAARRAGYVAACTTWGRPARPSDDPLRIPRLELKGSDSIMVFLRKLWFGDAY